ncbi:MAG: DUF1801 domain-containing protein [Anaerolineae bacterium]|nr:DUF1801 domain-containing protein [Anaerolineae bacterium]
MDASKKVAANIDEYIADFPDNVQSMLQEIRKTIHTAAPEATETIRYTMPTFKLNGKNLIFFAAFKNHIGFYPAPQDIESFKARLSAFKGSKGGVQFPLNRPIPADLVTDIVNFQVAEISKKR